MVSPTHSLSTTFSPESENMDISPDVTPPIDVFAEYYDLSSDDENEDRQSAYVPYVPNIDFGGPHPCEVVESESLASVQLPKIKHETLLNLVL